MRNPFLPALALLSLALSASADPGRILDVIYTKHDGVALTMDIFRPGRPNGAGINAAAIFCPPTDYLTWFDLRLLGKQPRKPSNFAVSSLPGTPVKKP